MQGCDAQCKSDAEAYRFGFNGKEADNETYGDRNEYDYGFRVYNPRIGKFLSVDPLTSSYPWYTPYQFAGNKPIAAVDLDGLEERIVIYNTTASGKVMTTIYDGVTLMMSTQLSGSYAHHKAISAEQWDNIKGDYWDAFSVLPNSFATGFAKYTMGMAGADRSKFDGPGNGTLTIGSGTNGFTLSFDPNKVKRDDNSISNAIKTGAKSYNKLFINPDKNDSRGQAFKKTVGAYVAGVSLAISAPALACGAAPATEYAGALSNIDQLTGGQLTNTNDPNLNVAISVVKTGIDLFSLSTNFKSLSSFNSPNISDPSAVVPGIITGAASTSIDATETVNQLPTH